MSRGRVRGLEGLLLRVCGLIIPYVVPRAVMFVVGKDLG